MKKNHFSALCCTIDLGYGGWLFKGNTRFPKNPINLIQQPKNQAIQMIHSLMSRIRYIFMHGHMRTT